MIKDNMIFINFKKTLRKLFSANDYVNKLIVLVIMFFGIVLVNYSLRSDLNLTVRLTSNAILIISSLLMVFSDPHPFSLNKILYLFIYLFLGIAPLVQYANDVTLWNHDPFQDIDYIRQNWIIISIIILYCFVYYISGKYQFCQKQNSFWQRNKNQRYNLNIKRLITLSVIASLIIVFVNRFDLRNILFREGGSVQIISFGQSGDLLITYFIRPIPIISLMLLKLENPKLHKVEFLQILLSILTVFPTALPRFFIAALYIPLVVIYLPKQSKKYLFLITLILSAFLIVFPLLDLARNLDKPLSLSIFSLDSFASGHFDSYQMFMRVVESNYITHGRQLLGVLFFFVPRALWADKPIGSGAYVARSEGYYFENISMNYFGEGYINYGLFGIAVFVIVIALFNNIIDKKYWSNVSSASFEISYLVLLGLEFFILRGDLLSSVSSSISLIMSIVIIGKIVIFKKSSE